MEIDLGKCDAPFVSSLRFALSDAEVETYHRDGVLGPYPLLSPVEMQAAQAVIDREIIGPHARDDHDLHFHDRHLDHHTVCRICRQQELIDRVASLLGPDLMIWRSNFQVKQPIAEAVGDAQHYTKVPWHQDGAYFGLQPQVLVSAWIAITEATEENGCLQVVAGSHKRTFDHDHDQERREFERSVPEDAIDHDSVRALVLRPGEFVLFNENTVHASGPNRTSRPRVGLTPRISVPFVRVTGNPRGAGRATRGGDASRPRLYWPAAISSPPLRRALRLRAATAPILQARVAAMPRQLARCSSRRFRGNRKAPPYAGVSPGGRGAGEEPSKRLEVQLNASVAGLEQITWRAEGDVVVDGDALVQRTGLRCPSTRGAGL